MILIQRETLLLGSERNNYTTNEDRVPSSDYTTNEDNVPSSDYTRMVFSPEYGFSIQVIMTHSVPTEKRYE